MGHADNRRPRDAEQPAGRQPGLVLDCRLYQPYVRT